MSTRNRVIVAPSILSANPLFFGRDIEAVEQAGADWHHVDVMDGHFVPNLTFGPPLIKELKKVSKIPLDVHIMVSNPDEVAQFYVEAGADILVFHIEAAKDAKKIIQTIRTKGAKVGVALNPATPIESVYDVAPLIDVIMVMSVNPGFGGQSFIETTVSRVKALYTWLASKNLDHKVRIEVDGGITEETGRRVVEAGASILVAGTFVYKAPDQGLAIKILKDL
jgi:ribulose-phosphate 3-epimerase